MNETLINDQLSWNEFFNESCKRKIYPPKTVELFNRLVAHTNNFFVVAAIGAFTPGYLMIITKEFIASYSLIKDRHINELRWLIDCVSKAIRETYDRETVTFEHGNCACLGGLDRAHLHIMTIKKNADDDLIKKCINKTLMNRKAGITAVEINGHKLENTHDIINVMKSSDTKLYKIHGKQLFYEDICSDFNIDKWPFSTRQHTLSNGQYVYFKTKSSDTSFLTNKNFQTQLGRQIVFEIEKETNNDMKNIVAEIFQKNNYSNIWKWQEFPFNKNMLETMSDLIPRLSDIKNSEFNYSTFGKNNK